MVIIPEGGPASLSAPLALVRVSSRRGWEAFQDQQPSQALGALETALEDGWVDASPVQLAPVDLEAPVGILGQAILVRRTPSRQVDVVDLRQVRLQGARAAIDLLPVEGSPGTVDIKPGENL